MNREVEERLVAMYFDNRDFEKNAKETINTLGQLKESMNLEDSVKGFDVFSKMKRNAGMDQMQKSANKLKDTFSSIGPILNKAFQVGTGPLRSMEHALSSLQGYVNKYLGFDFASKIVSGVENAMRSLTVQPISQGWAQYENEVDSVKTIMSSTGESIEVVTKHLDDLRDYADKTVYSLQDMTSNLGKFTNNGVELDKATKAMMGITNAAALAGQGTQQASMAMYNMSQAIGVGKMTSIDWKSIENANMATIQLKNSLLRVAAAQENLKTKVDESGAVTYWYAKDSNGKEIKDPKKWVEVNAKNFRDTLKEGWLTSDTLIATMTAFSGQKMSLQDWESIGIKDKELIAYLEKTGQQALEAASQVRTFSKMMATLKDSVASGWSQSFKYIFGDAEEAATFWTDVSNRIGDAMSSGAERRNDLLKKWKNTREILGTEVIDTGSNGGGLVERYIYGRNGREILIDSLNNLMDVFTSLGSAVKKAFGSVFQTLGSGDLFSKTQEFEKLTIRIKEWLGTLDDSNSRLNKIFRIVRGVLSVFKVWKDTIRGLVDTVVRLLFPSADSMLDILANVADFFYELTNLNPGQILVKIGEKLKQGWTKIKSFFTPQDLFDKFGKKIGVNIPILQWISNLWDQLKAAGSQVLTDLGLGGVVSFIESIRGHLETAWETVSGWEGWPVIGKFFGDVWGWLTEKFGDITSWFTTPAEGENKTGFVLFIESVKTKFDTAVNAIKNWPVWAKVKEFFGNVFNWISHNVQSVVGWFTTPTEGENKTGFVLFIESVKTKFDSTVNAIKNWPIWSKVKEFFGNVFNWISNNVQSVVGWFTTPTEGENKTGFVLFIESVKTKFDSTVNAIKNWPVWAKAKEFFGNVFNWISHNVQSVTGWFTNPKEGEKTGFVLFLEGVAESIRSTWQNLFESEEAKAVWDSISKFFTDTFNWIAGIITGGNNSGTESASEVEKSAGETAQTTQAIADAIGANIGVFGTIKKAAEDIPPEASSFFDNIQPVLDFFEEIGKVFEKIFGAIGKFFTENKDVLVDDFINLITGFGTFFAGLMDSVGTIFTYIGKRLTGAEDADDAGKEVGDILTALGDIIEKVLNPIIGKLLPYIAGDLALSGLRKWLGGNGIISDISSVMQSLGILLLAIAALKYVNVTEADIQMYGKYMLVGIGAILAIIGGLSLFNVAQGKNATAILKAQNADGAGAKIAKSAVSAAEMVGGLAVAFALLPNIIKAIGEAKKAAGGKDLGVDILLTVIGTIASVVVGAIGLLVVSKLADVMKASWGGIIKAGLFVAAVIAVIAGCMALINAAFKDEGGAEALAKKAEATRDAVKNVVGIFGEIVKEALGAVGEGLGDFAGGLIGGLLGGTGQGIGTAISAVKTAISGEDLTDSQRMVLEMQAEQDKLTTITDAMIKLAELMKSEDIANLKDVFADLSNFASAGTFGQGLNLDNFSKGFAALATTLVGIADALTQNDSALFRVMNDADLEEKLYKTIDALKKIMTIFNGIDGDALKFISGDEFFKAFGNLHIFFSGQNTFFKMPSQSEMSANPFTRFIQDINNMIDIMLETFDFEKYTLNEDKLNRVIDLFGSMSDSISKASDALEKLKALKDKYTVQSKQVAVLKDEVTYIAPSDNYNWSVTDPDIIRFNYKKALENGRSLGLKPEDFVDHYETEIVDPGTDLATILEQVLSVFDRLIAVFESHPNLTNGKYDRFADYFGKLSSAFGMFGGAEGVGSTTWMENYSGFADLVNDEQFVEKYVDNLEKIYAAFQGSDLAGGEDVITFNGIGYVQKLFDAIQEGLNSNDLPTLDGTPIITAIGQAIGIGKETITRAITLMVQEGIQDVTVPETGGTMTKEGEVVNQQVVEYIAKLANGDFFNFNIDTSVLESAIQPMIAELDNPNSPINQMMNQLEAKLGNTLNLNKFMNESGLMFKDEETGEMTNVFDYVTQLSNQLSDSLNSQDPITFGVTPVFTLDELTRANLQEQLNGLGLGVPVNMPEVSIDFTALKTSLDIDAIKLKLDAINSSIVSWGSSNYSATSNLGSHMDGIRDEIARMQMVLDTGVMVGQMLPMIDAGLYNRALLEYRSGSSPKAPKFVADGAYTMTR